jgi:DNA-binding winged helix-turn-helix (wHTH) protein
VQYAFEDYVIDSDRRELTRSAEPIAVGPQVFDLLLHLVRNREHVVSKEELLDAVWAGRIVSESTMTSHINAARKAIGDSGQNQRLLRTIARKGFRFVGDVSEIANRSAAVSTEPDAPGKTIAEAPALPDRPSIAALPFLNLSGDIEQEYFTDGVVEDIITALSRIRWLFVIARNSSFTYKGRAVDVKQVGRELGDAAPNDRSEAGHGEAEGGRRPQAGCALSAGVDHWTEHNEPTTRARGCCRSPRLEGRGRLFRQWRVRRQGA